MFSDEECLDATAVVRVPIAGYQFEPDAVGDNDMNVDVEQHNDEVRKKCNLFIQ